MRRAIDEMLRCEAPVQRLSRMASCDFELRGCDIERGDLIFFMSSASDALSALALAHLAIDDGHVRPLGARRVFSSAPFVITGLVSSAGVGLLWAGPSAPLADDRLPAPGASW